MESAPNFIIKRIKEAMSHEPMKEQSASFSSFYKIFLSFLISLTKLFTVLPLKYFFLNFV
jgi:hypothetical protein